VNNRTRPSVQNFKPENHRALWGGNLLRFNISEGPLRHGPVCAVTSDAAPPEGFRVVPPSFRTRHIPQRVWMSIDGKSHGFSSPLHKTTHFLKRDGNHRRYADARIGYSIVHGHASLGLIMCFGSTKNLDMNEAHREVSIWHQNSNPKYSSSLRSCLTHSFR